MKTILIMIDAWARLYQGFAGLREHGLPKPCKLWHVQGTMGPRKLGLHKII